MNKCCAQPRIQSTVLCDWPKILINLFSSCATWHKVRCVVYVCGDWRVETEGDVHDSILQLAAYSSSARFTWSVLNFVVHKLYCSISKLFERCLCARTFLAFLYLLIPRSYRISSHISVCAFVCAECSLCPVMYMRW